MARAELEAFLTSHKIEVKSTFVPWSQSRNAEEEQPSLNWKVTICQDGRPILSTDYGAGMAHCPSYKYPATVDSAEAVKRECESGNHRPAKFGKSSPILPDPCDVLACLAMDADVIDCPTFEDYAANYGLNPDSRQEERAYRACLEVALKLRALGEDGLKALREAAQDY